MTSEELFRQIRRKRSFLCIGLDTDIRRVPDFLKHLPDPVFEFNKRIIDATAAHCVAYKPNTAFYECRGAAGWQSLAATIKYISKEHFIIADAKRGDIGNTSELYARAFFEELGADAVTVAPYMGEDSVKPFLSFREKWVVLLVLTSNSGSRDFQTLPLADRAPLYEEVLRKSREWAGPDRMMYVVGATRAKAMAGIRKMVPDHFLLVPGVGHQGGDLNDVARYGLNSRCGLLVNASRSILYASSGPDFDVAASDEAQRMREQMDGLLQKYLPGIG